ncbi:uncharacterized protein LOC125241110 isoform X2 [Leguminivora glycinivorella]|uniref:uncharacterized protein LOC125241110 isoform X2 n=1 Tax=Leguminivora glycinivorella TaxID=1035111 RepID=UPI00200CE5FD|nr:uncharacterized protein LOC125241110 isoform X2 [Leguminivora glycinivorella]
MRGPAVLFVGFIFFASGLTKPVKKIRVRHVQQHDVSPETNSSSINGMMNASNEKDKIFDLLDRKQTITLSSHSMKYLVLPRPG